MLFRSQRRVGFYPIACYDADATRGRVMRSTQQMSITLPRDMAQRIKDRVETGRYASESEVIRESIRALEEREAAIARWLREEVAPVYDAHKADPSAAAPIADVRKRLKAFMSGTRRKAP